MHAVESPGRFMPDGPRMAFGRGDSSPDHAWWEVAADQLVCVGESTTESPGRGEDWQLCLITDVHGAWVEGSLYSRGRNDALQWLSTVTGSSVEVKLAHAPPFRSRVMWPPRLRDRPLFDYQVPLLRRAFSRSLRRLGFASRGGVQTVQPAVLDYLWRTQKKTALRSA